MKILFREVQGELQSTFNLIQKTVKPKKKIPTKNTDKKLS